MRAHGIAVIAAMTTALAGAAAPRAQTYDDVQQRAVELYGSAQQYATQAWRRLFPEQVEICIGYGTEKETWIRQEVAKFSKDPANRNLTIKLAPIGSLVGAEAIEKHAGKVTGGGVSCTMTAWSPASAAYRDFVLQRTYRAIAAGGASAPGITGPNDLLAAQASSLVRIPLVFVMWPDTYKRVVEAAHAAGVSGTTDAAIFSFDTLQRVEQAAAADGSFTTFYTTNPAESNSGFSTLLLMGYEFTNPGRGGLDANQLSPRNTAFWSKVRQFYTSQDGKSLKNFNVESTGTLFRENFVVAGPQSDVSGVVSYENLAIQYADMARKTFNTSYRVVYPTRGVMADNPYYVLNAVYDGDAHKVVMVPEAQKKAAIAFMQFLLEPEQQQEAAQLGFRPGNLQAGIDIAGANSPFLAAKDIGVQTSPAGVRFVSTNNVGEAVIGNLLTGWNDLVKSLAP